MASLLSYFADFFTFGLNLGEKLAHGGYPETSTQVYASLRSQIDAAQSAAVKGQKRKQDVDEATFAVVAWLDEIMARHAEWYGHPKPLQLTLFDTRGAGEEFFVHLGQLSAQQDEVREVYYVALCLGFVGQYYYETGDSGELGRLKESYSRQLSVKLASLPALPEEKITAQPYQLADPRPRTLGRWPEKLARAGVAVALATIAGILVYAYWPANLPALVQEERPDLATVQKYLSDRPCHDLQAAHDSSGNGSVVVSGHVPDVSAREAIAKDLKAMPGGAKIAVQLETLKSPFCEVVSLAHPRRQPNSGFNVSLRGAKERMAEGEIITVDAKLPGHAACVYVDYFVADGETVVHLFPSASDPENCGDAGDELSVGEPEEGKVPWKVSPPFGREMVLAIASRTPLFTKAREELESPKEYLRELEKKLKEQGGQVIADYLLITTEER